MLPSKPRRRVSSMHADTHQAFTIGDINGFDDIHEKMSRRLWDRHKLMLPLLITLLFSVCLCLVDIFLLDEPLALFRIRLFAWFGLPSLISLCLSMAVVMFHVLAAVTSFMSGRDSLLASQTRKHENILICSILLVLAELIICRFWLSGGLELFFMGEFRQIGALAFDICSVRLIQAIEICQIIYWLLFCWVILSIAVTFVKNMVISQALADDIDQIRLNRHILSTLCCESQRQRDRLFQKWHAQGLHSGADILEDIDAVRENPVRLPLTASLKQNQVQKWVYSETESVDVTSLAQMHILSAKIHGNIFSELSTILTYKQWLTLFHDEDVAEQAWTLMFSFVNASDASSISEHQFGLSLSKAYTRHALLQGKIRNFDSIFRIFKMMAAAVWSFAMIYVISTILRHNPTFVLLSLLAFFGSVTFAVSSSINYAVVSVIFILFKKPYQVGDRVSIDGADYYVELIDLLSTTFRATDNRCLIMSNYSLSAMKIYNHQLSSPAIVEWVVTLDSEVTDDQIDQLRQGLIYYARRHLDFWKPQIVFLLNHLQDGSLKLTVKAFHRLNWQQSGIIAEHQTAMIEEFRRLHLSMGIATGSPEARYQVTTAPAA